MVKSVNTAGSNPVEGNLAAGSTPAKSTQVCTRCLEEQSLENFSFKLKALGVRQPRCKKCQAVYGKTHYLANSAKYKKSSKNANPSLKRRNSIWVHAQKVGKPCTDCHRKFPAICMDFDHVDSRNKEYCVSVLVATCASIKRIMMEIAKCELVCSNCHRIRTYKRLHQRQPE